MHLFECLNDEEFPVICSSFEGRFHSAFLQIERRKSLPYADIMLQLNRLWIHVHCQAASRGACPPPPSGSATDYEPQCGMCIALRARDSDTDRKSNCAIFIGLYRYRPRPISRSVLVNWVYTMIAIHVLCSLHHTGAE